MSGSSQSHSGDEGEGGGKRRRVLVARACDRCRAGKRKCSGHAPCARCTRLQRPCVFADSPPSAASPPAASPPAARICPCGLTVNFGAGPRACVCGNPIANCPYTQAVLDGTADIYPTQCPNTVREEVLKAFAAAAHATATRFGAARAAAAARGLPRSLQLLQAQSSAAFAALPRVRDAVLRAARGEAPAAARAAVAERADALDAVFVLAPRDAALGSAALFAHAAPVLVTRGLLDLFGVRDVAAADDGGGARLLARVAPLPLAALAQQPAFERQAAGICRLQFAQQTRVYVPLAHGSAFTALALGDVFYDDDGRPCVVSFRFNDVVEVPRTDTTTSDASESASSTSVASSAPEHSSASSSMPPPPLDQAEVASALYSADTPDNTPDMSNNEAETDSQLSGKKRERDQFSDVLPALDDAATFTFTNDAEQSLLWESETFDSFF